MKTTQSPGTDNSADIYCHQTTKPSNYQINPMAPNQPMSSPLSLSAPLHGQESVPPAVQSSVLRDEGDGIHDLALGRRLQAPFLLRDLKEEIIYW
jgi:hypothetical protein